MTGTLLERLRVKHSLPSPTLRRAIRVDAGASQADIAQEMGVAQRTISRWESGDASPRGERLAAYARLLAELQDVAR